MALVPDPIQDGIQRGWKIMGGAFAERPDTLNCDVCIIGSGAGAGISAELLTRAGLDVLIVEEGPLKSSRDFRMSEAEAYPQLYQESAARKTADKAINILQGRAVGGSTTVNWTSSFRTPDATLAWWRDRYGLSDFTPETLAPWFIQAEQRLNIGPWLLPPNENNDILLRGTRALGIASAAILRNVKGCWNLGYCGMGCPTNAKQSMLVTTLPSALDGGARLLVETRAQQFEFAGERVAALLCVGALPDGDAAPGKATRITAKHYVLAGGAINSPALLLRSKAPDPHGLLGTRTFLHPTVISAALFDHAVDGYKGAPQTIYSDHFLHTQALDGPLGYKLEAPPLHPVLFASTMQGFGAPHAERMRDFTRSQAIIALMRDGFHPQSVGGTVALRSNGQPVLDYPVHDVVFEAARRALLTMAEVQFAAGAREVTPVHEAGRAYKRWPEAREAIAALPMKPYVLRLVSAHVMGGCRMAGSATQGVVQPDGVHWQVPNLSVHDGSLFPTSIGANPQLSIYGIVNRMATRLAKQLSGKDVRLAAPDAASATAQNISLPHPLNLPTRP
ncbi:MAG: GMC family oxidoreductase [Betaproteobacteria bacterium]|nr:GMC family oxidoreductase [Betaproteobacteria bacterium]